MEFARANAEPGRRRLRGGGEHRKRGDAEKGGPDHLSSGVRENDEAPGITAPASAFSHCSINEQ